MGTRGMGVLMCMWMHAVSQAERHCTGHRTLHGGSRHDMKITSCINIINIMMLIIVTMVLVVIIKLLSW